MRPTLRQLRYAVAVAEHRNFRAAAEACHVSQPGLSAQLRELEHALGVRLFERDRRGVLTTAAGESLLPRAREILALADDLGAAARALAAPLSGTMRLGVIPTVAPYLLPRVLPALRRRHPQLRLLLREDRTADLVERLDDGRLDVLLLALEADLGHATTLPLFEDPFVLALPPGHRLAARRRVAERDLAGEEILLLDDGHCLRAQALAVCERAGAPELGDLRATGLATLLQMVASGIGVTLLPEMAARVERGVATVPFRAPAPYRTIGLAWRRASARDEEFRMLGQTLTPSGRKGHT